MKPEDWTPRIREGVDALAREDGFLVSSGGGIRWTSRGLKTMRARFAAAGIDIRDLRILEQYVRARRIIAPLLNQELAKIARRQGPITDERELLIAAVDESEARVRQLELKLKNRKSRKP